MVANVAVPVKVGPDCMAKVVPVPVCAAIEVAFPTEVIGPVRFAFVVTLPQVKPDAVPVMLVPTSADGVPRDGVTRTGEFDSTTVDPLPVVVAATNWLLLFVATGKPGPIFTVTVAGEMVEKVVVPGTIPEIVGVVIVGLEAKTTAPDPVELPEMAIVPELVMGLPATERKEGTVIATEVTVPMPALPQTSTPPDSVRVWPSFPFASLDSVSVADAKSRSPVA